MTWTFYWFLVVFFGVVFAVFYLVAYSVFLGVVDNYRRYYQKSELQWTGPGRGTGRQTPSRLKLAALSLLTAWLVVHFIIQP